MTLPRKLMAIAGARPQFIKHAILASVLGEHFKLSWLNTGQHFDYTMSGELINELKIRQPDFVLETKDLGGAARMAEMIKGIAGSCEIFQPDAMVVYGDTDSTLAGAIAANKMSIPLIHVEAGLRCQNYEMPEEINRILTDTLSDFNFCPGHNALVNLEKAGVKGRSFVSGDVMKDLFLQKIPEIKDKTVDFPYIFATIHRGFNTISGKHLKEILFHLNAAPLKVIMPVHPRTARSLANFDLAPDRFPNILFIDPLSYMSSLAYQKCAEYIITDSGGIQKEAYWFRKPCITIRPETEWTETVDHGWNKIVWNQWEELKCSPAVPTSHDESLYGTGNSSQNIAGILKSVI